MTLSNRHRGRAAPAIASDLDALRELLETLSELAKTLPGDDPESLEPISQWQDGDFQRRYRMLEIDLMGIDGLASRAEGDEALRAAVNYRLGVTKTALIELIISTLGYQALPNPDPLLIDNEGPIGHHQALALMRAVGDYFEPRPGMAEGGYASGSDQEYELKDTIARRVFASPGDS